MEFGATRPQRQNWVQPIQRLNGGLLIYTLGDHLKTGQS
jgi:hypothetical protein